MFQNSLKAESIGNRETAAKVPEQVTATGFSFAFIAPFGRSA
jgi:hypothetical protein